MKAYQALLPLVAAMMMAGCGSRGTAENAVTQADGIINRTRDEAQPDAPAEFKAAEDTVAHMKSSLASHDYKDVIADVPKFNAQMETVKDAVTSKQTAAAAANQEWSTLNTEVPQSVDAIQARVDSLKPGALPKEVTKEELASAKADLETMKATWSEATALASAGKTLEATDKGRLVQAKAEELKTTLAMNETVASAG